MPPAPQIAPRRLLVLMALATSGLLAAATAFTVIVASTAQRRPLRLDPSTSAGRHFGAENASAGESSVIAARDLADPKGVRVAAVVSNAALTPEYRESVALTFVSRGACLRVREVLFGPDRERWQGLERLDVALQDLPSRDVSAATRRELLRKFETGLAEGSLRSPALDIVLRAVVPAAARARIYYCHAVTSYTA